MEQELMGVLGRLCFGLGIYLMISGSMLIISFGGLSWVWLNTIGGGLLGFGAVVGWD